MFIKSLFVRTLLYVAETHEKDKGDLIENVHKLMKLCQTGKGQVCVSKCVQEVSKAHRTNPPPIISNLCGRKNRK